MRTLLVLIISLSLSLTFLYDQEVFVLPEINQPESMTLDGNRLLVVQPGDAMVFCYDIRNGSLLHSFCKKGEGPGEMRRTPHLTVLPQKYALYFRGKLAFYDKEGRYQDEQKMDPSWIRVIPVENNYLAVVHHFSSETHSSTLEFCLVNDRRQKTKTLYTGVWDVNTGTSKGFSSFKMLGHYLDVVVWNSNIYIADSSKGLFILVFNGQTGEKMHEIRKDLNPVRISREYRSELIAEFKIEEAEVWPMVKNVYSFPDFFPAIRSMLVSPDGIVLTGFNTQNKRHELLFLSDMGRDIRSAFLSLPSWRILPKFGRRVDLFAISHRTLYQLQEDPDSELYALHTSPMEAQNPK